MAGMLLFALDQGIVGTALPRIVSELGGLDKLSWVVTAYLLTSTATTPLWGKISDLYGRRLIFQVAIIIFLIGSALSGLSQNMGQLIAFRALQGVGGAPVRHRPRHHRRRHPAPRSRPLPGLLRGRVRRLQHRRPPAGRLAHRRARLALDLLHQPARRPGRAVRDLGGADDAGDPPPAQDRLPGRRHHRRRRHLPAAVPGLAGQPVRLDRALGDGPARGAAGLAALFIWIERRAVEPIIPMRLFRIQVFSVGNAFAFLAGIVMFGTIIFLPVYFQAVMGMSRPSRAWPCCRRSGSSRPRSPRGS